MGRQWKHNGPPQTGFDRPRCEFAVGHLERQVMSVSLNAIGLEFSLSDTQLGRLSGAVFAIIIAKPFVLGFLFLDSTPLALSSFAVSASLATVFWAPSLAATYAVGHLERQVMSVSLNAIGLEFSLSDTQLGLLSGAVFALVFAVCGIPLARLAAWYPRRIIIAISVLVSGALTVATSGAQTFAHLLITRLGVGEAGGLALSIVQVCGVWAAFHYWKVTQLMTLRAATH
jgi:predicted MFS family arabinose efflux permease